MKTKRPLVDRVLGSIPGRWALVYALAVLDDQFDPGNIRPGDRVRATQARLPNGMPRLGTVHPARLELVSWPYRRGLAYWVWIVEQWLYTRFNRLVEVRYDDGARSGALSRDELRARFTRLDPKET